jgi:hypothetical protein
MLIIARHLIVVMEEWVLRGWGGVATPTGSDPLEVAPTRNQLPDHSSTFDS